MNEEVLQDLTSKDEVLAAMCSRGYRLLCMALGYPDAELCDAIRSGELAEALREDLGGIDPAIIEGTDWDALGDAGDEDDLAVEYTRLFDVGPSGPPCPLYGGLYGGVRMKTMEEAVRFYNHFGLSLSEEPRELPDHLSTELEFLHFLSYREAEALQSGDDPGPYRRARRDFVERHPGSWVPKLRERVEAQDPMPFFRELIRLLERFLESERQRLAS